MFEVVGVTKCKGWLVIVTDIREDSEMCLSGHKRESKGHPWVP